MAKPYQPLLPLISYAQVVTPAHFANKSFPPIIHTHCLVPSSRDGEDPHASMTQESSLVTRGLAQTGTASEVAPPVQSALLQTLHDAINGAP